MVLQLSFSTSGFGICAYGVNDKNIIYNLKAIRDDT